MALNYRHRHHRYHYRYRFRRHYRHYSRKNMIHIFVIYMFAFCCHCKTLPMLMTSVYFFIKLVFFFRVAEASEYNEKTLILFQVNILSIPGLLLHLANLSPQVK